METYMGQITGKNLGVHDIWRSLLVMNEDNERQTWTLAGLSDLADSLLRTGGNVTPGIVEWMEPGDPSGLEAAIASSESDARFRIYGGNRRYLALGLVEIPKMRARVLQGLTDEERLEIQFVENSTKTKIPAQQVGDSIWELYLFRSAIENRIHDPDEIRRFQFPDYWSMPAKLRDTLSIKRFADMIHKDESVVRNAFRYQRTNKMIRRAVDEGKLSYSVAAEFGRIPNKNDQMVNLARAKGAGSLNTRKIGPYITAYLQSLKPQEHSELQLIQESPKIDLYRGVSRDLSDLSSMLQKIQFIIETDSSVLNMNGRFFSNERLSDIITDIRGRLKALDEHYSQERAYQDAKSRHAEKSKGKTSLLDQILNGDRRIESDETAIEGLDLSHAEYSPFIPIDDISPCNVQPRTGFRTGDYDKRRFDDMVTTIAKFGILQPVLVRPGGEGYEIVVGETRYRAAREAGLQGIDALVLDMDDVTARIIQIEEDFYEQVLPMERATKLFRLWNMKKDVRGDGYTRAEFCREHKLGQDTLRESLIFMALDDNTKRLYETGLLGWQNSLLLEKVQDPEKRFQYAMLSVILDIRPKELRRKIYQDSTQLMLPLGDFDHHKETIKSLQAAAIDKLGKKREILYRTKHVSDDMKTRRTIDLMENLTRREHYMKLFEISETAERIYQLTG